MYSWVDTDTSKRRVRRLGRRSVLAAAAGALMLAVGGAGALAEPGAAAAAASGGEGAGPSFVKVDWLMVQARQTDGRRRSISLLLTLEVAERDATELVARNLRQLRDAYLQALSSPPLVRTARDRVDPEDVKVRVAKANKRVLGENVVGHVLVRNINDFGAQ